MKLRILGCSGGAGLGLRTTSLLIDHDILIDAGTGVGDLRLDQLCQIEHIFLTHSHMDHIAVLPLLADSVFDRIDHTITIHARQETIEALEKHVFNWAIWPDFTQLPNPDRPVLRIEAMSPGATLELKQGRRIEMIPVNHIVPGVGYRVQSETGSFAFSGDTCTNDSLWQALNAHEGLDLLIVESAFTNDNRELAIKAGHYCPDILAADLQKLKHNPQIYITHTKPGQEKAIFDECRKAIKNRSLQCLLGGEVFEV